MATSGVVRLMRHPRAKGLVAALALVGSGVAAAALLAGGSDHTVQIGAGLVANPAIGVSVTIPDGWQELPRVERPDPDEVLVVGTGARPPGEPIEACGTTNAVPGTRSGYITVYEYPSHGPFPSLDGTWEYPYDMFQPRPPDFGSQYGMGNECDLTGQPIDYPVLPDFVGEPAQPNAPLQAIDPTATTGVEPTTSTVAPTTLPPPVNHFREFAFTEADRAFVARVVTVDDATDELLTQAFAILNSLRVELPAVTTTTVDVGPSDKESARQEILDAFRAAFGITSSVPFADSVEGGHPLATEEQKKEAKEIASNADDLSRKAVDASERGGLDIRINWIEWDSPTRATVNFDLLVDGQPGTANTTGYAVDENGHWRMGRDTYCEITGRGGVQCPT